MSLNIYTCKHFPLITFIKIHSFDRHCYFFGYLLQVLLEIPINPRSSFAVFHFACWKNLLTPRTDHFDTVSKLSREWLICVKTIEVYLVRGAILCQGFLQWTTNMQTAGQKRKKIRDLVLMVGPKAHARTKSVGCTSGKRQLRLLPDKILLRKVNWRRKRPKEAVVDSCWT